MHPHAVENTDRLQRLAADIEKLRLEVSETPRAQQLFRSVLQQCLDAAAADRAAAGGAAPADFVAQLSIAVRRIRRAISSLVLLVQLDYLPIENAREPIIEARELEQLLTKTRNKAKRRHRPGSAA